MLLFSSILIRSDPVTIISSGRSSQAVCTNAGLRYCGQCCIKVCVNGKSHQGEVAVSLSGRTQPSASAHESEARALVCQPEIVSLEYLATTLALRGLLTGNMKSLKYQSGSAQAGISTSRHHLRPRQANTKHMTFRPFRHWSLFVRRTGIIIRSLSAYESPSVRSIHRKQQHRGIVGGRVSLPRQTKWLILSHQQVTKCQASE